MLNLKKKEKAEFSGKERQIDRGDTLRLKVNGQLGFCREERYRQR